MQQTIKKNYEKSMLSRCSHSKEVGDKSDKYLYYLLLPFQIISHFSISRYIDFTTYLFLKKTLKRVSHIKDQDIHYV